MSNVELKRGPISLESYAVAGHYSAPYCKLTSVVVPAQSVIRNVTDAGVVKTLIKGDHVKALPYTTTVIETVPITGKVTTTCTILDPRPSHTAFCGVKPVRQTTWSGDIGYSVSTTRLTSPPTVPPSVKATLIGIANTKANADLRQSMLNVPLLIADRRETTQYLLSKGKLIAGLVSKAQREGLNRYYRAAFRDRRRVANEIANEHLGLLFGLLPLLDEIQGACELYSKPEMKILTGRGRMASESTAKTDLSVLPSGSYGMIAADYASAYYANRVAVTRFSVRTSISVDISLSSAQLARDVGFNPLAVAYDLVPLSFLSDFVSNLGSFIRALDPLIGVQFRTGSTTVWEEYKETVTYQGTTVTFNTSAVAATLQSLGAATGFGRSLRVTRTPLSTFPDNSLHFVNNMTAGKFFIGVSLAVQRYVKPLRALLRVKQFRYKGPRPKYLPPIKYR